MKKEAIKIILKPLSEGWYHSIDDLALDFSQAFRHLITYTHSITDYANQYFGGTVVKNISQGWQPINLDDADYLQRSEQDEVYVRQIMMYCQNQPWWHGYTVVPKPTTDNFGAAILTLGSKSLGSFLYAQPDNVSRSVVEYKLIYPEQPFYNIACPLEFRSKNPIVTRRSIYYVQQYPLSVTETFLPPAMMVSDVRKHNAHA